MLRFRNRFQLLGVKSILSLWWYKLETIKNLSVLQIKASVRCTDCSSGAIIVMIKIHIEFTSLYNQSCTGAYVYSLLQWAGIRFSDIFVYACTFNVALRCTADSINLGLWVLTFVHDGTFKGTGGKCSQLFAFDPFTTFNELCHCHRSNKIINKWLIRI